MHAFSPRHQQTLAVAFMDLHDRLTHMEGLIAQADHPTAFARYFADLPPGELQAVRDYFAEIRDAMQKLLAANQIPVNVTPVSLRWALETGLVYLQVAVEEMSPKHLRGYGALTPEGQDAAQAIKEELGRLVAQALGYLRRAPGGTDPSGESQP
jgi:hypothetical protein